MKKLIFIPILACIMSLALYCAPSFAVVDYMEILSIGTSTTPAVGSSTVFADTTRNYAGYPYFEAQISYSNTTAGVPLRYWITTGTPTATSGDVVADGDILVLRNLEDMKNFKACAGTTTTASYGTASVRYCPSHKPDKSPLYINP